MIYCNFISCVKIKVISVKAEVSITLAFIHQLFFTRSKLTNIDSRLLADLIVNTIWNELLSIPRSNPIADYNILDSSIFFDFFINTPT